MEVNSKVSRRSFIKKAATGVAAGVTFLPDRASWAGAGERVRVAVIGIRGMGQNHISSYMKLPNVEVAALCDVDENRARNTFNKYPQAKKYHDYRVMLEKEDKNKYKFY